MSIMRARRRPRSPPSVPPFVPPCDLVPRPGNTKQADKCASWLGQAGSAASAPHAHHRACLLACLETGPVPAYSRALVGRSGPRDLHKYQVLAPAPPRRYVGVVLLLSDRGEAAVERCWVGGLSSMMGRGVGDREGGEVAAAASSPPSLSVACPFCPSPVAFQLPPKCMRMLERSVRGVEGGLSRRPLPVSRPAAWARVLPRLAPLDAPCARRRSCWDRQHSYTRKANAALSMGACLVLATRSVGRGMELPFNVQTGSKED